MIKKGDNYLEKRRFGEKNRETHVLKIRQYNQLIKPIKAVITGKTGYTKKCKFVLESSDKLGNVYACKLDKNLYGEKYLSTIIELSDKEKFEVEYQIRHDTFYSPLFSFNGPEPKIEVVFEHSR